MPDFLQFSGKTVLIFGVANRKSVAWFIARTLEEQGARVVYSVRSETRKKSLETLLAGKPVFLCDVERPEEVERLAAAIAAAVPRISRTKQLKVTSGAHASKDQFCLE